MARRWTARPSKWAKPVPATSAAAHAPESHHFPQNPDRTAGGGGELEDEEDQDSNGTPHFRKGIESPGFRIEPAQGGHAPPGVPAGLDRAGVRPARAGHVGHPGRPRRESPE